MSTAALPLHPALTREVAHVRHRLALGLTLLDAQAGQPAGGMSCRLEALGDRSLSQTLAAHDHGRHALLLRDYAARVMTRAASDKTSMPPPLAADDPTRLLISIAAGRGASSTWHAQDDPRRYVPRRLALIPQLDGLQPAGGWVNIREVGLWPGARWPLPANATAVRGRIRSGPDADSLAPVAWARVTLTRPADPLAAADFDNEAVVGWAHGDDRGEFLAVLGSELLPGGAVLPASVTVRLWVFLPPAGGSDNAFDQLPIEIAGSDLHNAVLAGTAAPPGYVRQAAVTRILSPGEVSTIHDDALDYLPP